MAEVSIVIAGRTYQVACRAGEEDDLLAAARLVDAKSREALSGLGTLSESRQLLFASLLLADQLLDKPGAQGAPIDPGLAPRVERLAARIEQLAQSLEAESTNA